MKSIDKDTIFYFGFNSFNGHKRGVENVILFQSQASDVRRKIYIYFGEKDAVYHWRNLICISIRKSVWRFFSLNLLILKLWRIKGRKIIHSHNFLMTFFLLRKTDIFTVHDGLYYQYKKLNRSFLFLFMLIEKCVYFKSKKIHFISNFAKDKSLCKVDRKTTIIYNTSYIEAILNKNLVSLDIKSYAYDYIFVVRSMEARARIDLLIDVAEVFQRKKRDEHIVIAGKGPLLEYYKALIAKKGLNNIHLIGFISDKELMEHYFNCKMVLMIAEYGEGFGLPIIEGYLFNKPVIASNRCAIPEVIISKDFLFENNVEDITIKIDYASDIKNFNYKDFYDQCFGSNIILNKYKSLYNSSFQDIE